jgi:four helix bundle protein
MLRSGTSVGANYRAACRARSRRDFIAKLGIVEEEADETIYWIELLIESELIKRARVADLLQESDEILSIVISSIKTARAGDVRSVSKPAIRNSQSAII